MISVGQLRRRSPAAYLWTKTLNAQCSTYLSRGTASARAILGVIAQKPLYAAFLMIFAPTFEARGVYVSSAVKASSLPHKQHGSTEIVSHTTTVWGFTPARRSRGPSLTLNFAVEANGEGLSFRRNRLTLDLNVCIHLSIRSTDLFV